MMKNYILKNCGAIVLLFLIVAAFSCKKKDEIIPAITVLKDTVDTIILNQKLIDPGAFASDNVDGDISPQITSDYLTIINKDSVGTYRVSYKITDKAGNINTASRLVYVMNQAQIWEGNYNAVDSLFNLPITTSADTFRKTYPVKIKASWYKNNVFWIGGFGKFTAPGYANINLIAYVADSSGIFTKADVPLSEKPLENLTFAAALSCPTSSHKIKSFQSFYLKTAAPKTIYMEYEDEVYAPASCIALIRGKLKLTYSSALTP